MWDNDADDQGGASDNDADDKRALLAQLGGMKMGAPMLGARGGGAPTANTLPVREAPMLPPPEAAPTPPLDQPAMVPPKQMPEDYGVGALAGLLQRPQQVLPPPPTPQNIGTAVQGVGNALKPSNVLNQLKPKTVLQNLRNPLVALGGLFGRRR